ncbi:MAG TPA: heparan-alpha-glucosaminide N-acetyltransferase domain-containing protein [Gemmatimonadales bacterium]|nr:heparan-alpha-glucosaminide N-acetyltransferase domain-containing protein [Gemmatimonadales bacterium]
MTRPSAAADFPAVSPPAPPTSHRLDAIDLVRGVVMVVMVLDHVRAYFTEARFDPTDLGRTSAALFLTRWVTHICAPTFVFLAGTSAWLSGRRRTTAELSRFLLTRGAWLVLLELTVVSFAWYLNLRFELGAFAQVIWAIGLAMTVLAALVHLPRAWVAAIGAALVAGHNLLDGITPASLGASAPLWTALHVQGPLGGLPVFVVYPLLPWIGVMALGYAAGPLLATPAGRRERLLGLGAVVTLTFVALRWTNLYGDPRPWAPQDDAVFTALAFVNLTKYPPSLLFLLMTLGPMFLLLGAAERARGPVARALVTVGRVPLVFYVAHLYLVHLLAVGAGALAGTDPGKLLTVFMLFPEDHGFGLPVIYLAWAIVVVALYPLCRWAAALKARHRAAWWVSYV